MRRENQYLDDFWRPQHDDTVHICTSWLGRKIIQNDLLSGWWNYWQHTNTMTRWRFFQQHVEIFLSGWWAKARSVKRNTHYHHNRKTYIYIYHYKTHYIITNIIIVVFYYHYKQKMIIIEHYTHIIIATITLGMIIFRSKGMAGWCFFCGDPHVSIGTTGMAGWKKTDSIMLYPASEIKTDISLC